MEKKKENRGKEPLRVQKSQGKIHTHTHTKQIFSHG